MVMPLSAPSAEIVYPDSMEQQRVERLAERLRALGIDPDALNAD